MERQLQKLVGSDMECTSVIEPYIYTYNNEWVVAGKVTTNLNRSNFGYIDLGCDGNIRLAVHPKYKKRSDIPVYLGYRDNKLYRGSWDKVNVVLITSVDNFNNMLKSNKLDLDNAKFSYIPKQLG